MRMYQFGSLSKGDWDKTANIANNKDKNSVANGNPPSATLINLKSDPLSNKGSIIYSVDGNKKSVNTER